MLSICFISSKFNQRFSFKILDSLNCGWCVDPHLQQLGLMTVVGRNLLMYIYKVLILISFSFLATNPI